MSSVTGNVPKDFSASHITYNTLTSCKGNIRAVNIQACDTISTDTTVTNNLIVNNLEVLNQVILPPEPPLPLLILLNLDSM